MVCGRYRHRHLDRRLTALAEQTAPPPIKGFAGFLRQDLDAILAGLTLNYSSGIVEGHVNRRKTLKRQMYNRAGLSLLRKRVLLA